MSKQEGKIVGEIAPSITQTLDASGNFSMVIPLIILLIGVATGLLIATLWKPAIADDAIGMNLASSILGRNAASVTITSSWLGLLFAIAAGLANTFTACNCVVFSCIAPLSEEKGQRRTGVKRLLLLMTAGVVATTALYGVFSVLLNQDIPSLSKAKLAIGHGVPVRLVQSTTVFVILGIILFYWGLVALRLAKNPLQRLVERNRWMVPFFLGVIVGCFSIGRPYPLFQTLFQYAASSGNVLLSALLIALQGICNIVVMVLLFVLLMFGTGGRFERWIQNNPFRAQALTALSVIGGGVFLIAYWGIRLPAGFGIGWFPHF